MCFGRCFAWRSYQQHHSSTCTSISSYMDIKRNVSGQFISTRPTRSHEKNTFRIGKCSQNDMKNLVLNLKEVSYPGSLLFKKPFLTNFSWISIPIIPIIPQLRKFSRMMKGRSSGGTRLKSPQWLGSWPGAKLCSEIGIAVPMRIDIFVYIYIYMYSRW